MEINIGGKKKEAPSKKKIKVEVITEKDISDMHSINQKSILALEKDSEIYLLKQEERDKNWSDSEFEIEENSKLLNQEIKSINQEISKININFTLLAKNFKNLIKKDELLFIKNKIDSIKFEELATDRDLEQGLLKLRT